VIKLAYSFERVGIITSYMNPVSKHARANPL
jgi:hypothetical protein